MAYEGFVDYWSSRLANHKPGDAGWRDEARRCLGGADQEFDLNIPGQLDLVDRVRQEALRKYRERKRRPVGKTPKLAMDYCGDTVQYGRPVFHHKLVDEIAQLQRYSFKMFNNGEGEKAMQKIDWHKPLRALRMYGDGTTEPKSDKVYTFKSGKQRVIWVEDRVYPVDDNGYAVADVNYGEHYVTKGYRIVENVPEEKFFLGLARDGNGTYWLTDGGHVSTERVIADYWAGLMKGTPHWVVDTRKSAEPPKEAEHDPKDWTTVQVHVDGRTVSSGLMTEAAAQTLAHTLSSVAVRVRTTPSPADAARYIQLYRRAGTNEAWEINGRPDRQEMTAGEVRQRPYGNQYCIVKVRD